MSFIDTFINGNVATIHFNRPDALNAFTTEMYADFADALIKVQVDATVKAVLLTAAGKDFCAGNDVASFLAADQIDPEMLADRNVTPSANVVHLLAELEKPLIGCLHGRAIGFGATMLLHCDFLIAEPSAVLIYPFSSIGIVPEAGCSLIMEKQIGRFETRKILMLGEPVGAEEAVVLGLVSELVSDGDAKQRGQQIADALAKKPGGAMRATKRLLNRDSEPIRERMTAEFTELGRRLRSDETQAIMRAFK